MKNLFFILLFYSLFSSNFLDANTNLYSKKKESPINNTILISIDGISRNTLYALIAKNKLPNLAKIITRGNYRNIEVNSEECSMVSSYTKLLTGSNNNDVFLTNEPNNKVVAFGKTIFEKIKNSKPELNVGVVFNSSSNYHEQIRFSQLFSEIPTESITVYPEENRDCKKTALLVNGFIEDNQEPFFIFVNFTDVEQIGHRYREGAELYSEAIRKCDTAIGEIIDRLEQEKAWESTHFYITTNYGFLPKSRKYKTANKIWLVSTKKVLRKGFLTDLMHSILANYGIYHDNIDHTDLFKN